jgi:hypothetical protein
MQRVQAVLRDENTLEFAGFLRAFASHCGKAGGGQGWIRTTVRSRGQIYSLLPLTTRPPVHTSAAGAG